MNLLIFRMLQLSPLVVFKRSYQPKVELHGREMADEFCLEMPDFHVTFRDLLHVVNLRHGTDGFTSPSEGRRAEDFFALKIPTASVGFEPTNLGAKGQHATSRPPKPLSCGCNFVSIVATLSFRGGKKANTWVHSEIHYLCF